MGASSAAMMDCVVFFKVVQSHPSRRKNVALPAAESKRLWARDMCVSFHKAVIVHMAAKDSSGQVCPAEPRLCVSVDAAAACGVSHQINVLSLCENNLPADGISALKHSMRQWEHSSKLVFILKDRRVSPPAMELLNESLLQRSFPQCSLQQCICMDVSNADRCQAVKEPCSAGAVEQRKAENSMSLWSLTEQGMKNIMRLRVVRRPEKVFRPADELSQLPLEDVKNCSCWELLQILWQKGWETQRGPQKAADRKALPAVTAAAEKNILCSPDRHVQQNKYIVLESLVLL